MPARLPCYTEAELRSPDGPNLPGLWTPAQVDINNPYGFFEGTDWQPVLNLAVVTEEVDVNGKTGLRMLTGSRPETEQTHPNVVSTPTQWIPDREQLKLDLDIHFFAPKILGQTTTSAGLPINPVLHLNEVNPTHFGVIANIEPHPVNVGGATLPLGRLTQRILAQKLGFEGWYDPGNQARLAAAGIHPSIGSVSLSRLLAGFSYVGENAHDEPVYEPIVMVGTVLHTPFPQLFPRKTDRYNNLTFTPLDDFSSNVKERNVGNLIKLDSELEEVMMCVRGLCLSTGSEMSVGPDLPEHGISFEIGQTYDQEAAAIIADMLKQRDEKGEQLAHETDAILGQEHFVRERIAYQRMAATDIQAGAGPHADDDQAAAIMGQLERSAAAAGQGFRFSVRKR